MSSPIGNSTFPYFTEEHEMLRDTLRRFIADKVTPNGDRWEKDGRVPRNVLEEMGSLGLLGMRYPPELGGAGLDTVANAIFAEELGRSGYGGFTATVLVHTDMASTHLYHAGSEEQKQRWMPDITAGKLITAIAMTEPSAGSDLASMRTTATRAQGGYLLNGSKMFITNGVHADLYFVAAKTGEQGRNRNITMFAVEKGADGFTVARQLEKHGWWCSDTAELAFEDCFVPEDNMIGAEGRGFYALVGNLQNERIVLGAQSCGESLKAIELTLDWVKERQAFGAPLWEKQAIRQRLSERLAQVEAARALLFNTAWRDANGEEVIKEVSMIKALCGDLVNKVTYDCLQFHGGTGYMQGTPIERMARDARVQSIGGGASEVMFEEIAKRI